MPKFVCDECDKAFRSKEALREHTESHSTSEDSFSLPDIDVSPRNIRSKLTTRNLAIVFGVVMMGTLFLGPVMSFAPTSPSGNTGNSASSETTPPSGFSVQTTADIPNIPQSAFPSQNVVSQPLSHDVQLNLLLRGGPQNAPAILFQYNCPNGCTETVNTLTSIADEYSGWVYVAPYPDMDRTVAATGFRSIDKMDTADRDRLETFICDTYAQLNANGPVACAVQ